MNGLESTSRNRYILYTHVHTILYYTLYLIALSQVSKIDDISLSMTFELYFDMTWTESRLIINETSPEWEAGDGTVMGSINFIKSMWLPDIQIQNLKNFQLRSIVTDVAGLIIFKDKKVLYTVATEAIISCPMKFSAYPLDHQVRKNSIEFEGQVQLV